MEVMFVVRRRVVMSCHTRSLPLFVGGTGVIRDSLQCKRVWSECAALQSTVTWPCPVLGTLFFIKVAESVGGVARTVSAHNVPDRRFSPIIVSPLCQSLQGCDCKLMASDVVFDRSGEPSVC